MFWDVLEQDRGYYYVLVHVGGVLGVFWDVLQRFGTFWDVLGRFGFLGGIFGTKLCQK